MDNNNPTTQTLNQLRAAQENVKNDLKGTLYALIEESGLPEREKRALRLRQNRLNELLRNRLSGTVSTEFEMREAQEIKSEVVEWIGQAVNQYGKLAEEAALTWPELKDKLLAIQQHNGLLPAADLLKQLVAEPVSLNALATLEKDYDDYVWQLNNALGDAYDWQEAYQSLNRRLSSLIHDFDPAELKPGWEGLYREATEDFTFHTEGQVFALISRTDRVQVPSQIVYAEEQQRYKRLLYHYQDDFVVGNYKSAYETLLKVRYELEVESAQLYEYLLLSYFRKTGSKKIVQQILTGRKAGEEDHLRYLMLYAGRAVSLQAEEAGEDLHPDLPHALTRKIHSNTVDYNVRQITRGLLLRLCEAMAELKYNYLEEGLLPKEHKVFAPLTNILRIAARINRFIPGDILFAEQLIQELVGGHRNQWISTDEDGVLVDNYPSVPARRLLRHARRLYSFSVDDLEESEHRIAEDVAIQLAEKYDHLVMQGQLGVRSRNEQAMAMIDCLNTFRTVAQIFPGDRLFYDTPIRELLEGESELNWYKFTSSGTLIQREELVSAFHFNVLDHLQYLITEKYGPEQWTALYSDLRQRQYELLREETADLLDQINSKAYRVRDATFTSVDRAIRYLKNCETLFHVYGDVQHLENGLQEILGNNNFHWFEIDSRGLTNGKLPEGLVFDAGLYLDRILRDREDVSFSECKKTIGRNYFRLHIERRYRVLMKERETYGELKAEEVIEIASLLRAAAAIFANIHQDPQYRDFILDELINERLIRYLDIDGAELIEHSDAIEAGFDVLGILGMLRSISVHNDRLDPDFLLKETVYNRKEDMDRYYYREFHPLRRHNYLDEDRLRMIQLIERYFQLSQIVNDRALLEIPYREYVLNHGRIRWGWSIVPSIGFQRPVGLFQHWRNANIPEFSFRKQRSLIYRAYVNAPLVERNRRKTLPKQAEAARLRDDIANA